jgi:carbon storage regulator
VLILGRRPGEAILIGDGIRVVVLEADRRGVRLGIEAPASVSILREEIVAQIAAQNRRAGAGADAKAWLDVVPVKK